MLKVGQTLEHAIFVLPAQQRQSLDQWGLREPLPTARVRDNLLFVVSRTKPEYSVISSRSLLNEADIHNMLNGPTEEFRTQTMDTDAWSNLVSELDLEQSLSLLTMASMMES